MAKRPGLEIVWGDLNAPDELREYPKLVSELDVE